MKTYMRKALFAALFLCVCAVASSAQTTDYRKGEFFAGYSANEVDTRGAFSTNPNDTGRNHFNGFNLEGTYNFTRYIGAQADFSYHQRRGDIIVGTTTTNVTARLAQFMGGVKIQDNANDARFRPFVHALVGVAHASGEVNNTFVNGSESDNGLALALGGGLDFRVAKKVDVRAVQVDYNPTHIVGETDHNIRISTGLNFRF
jgi:opacity protein-like surface antigen